MTYGYNQSVNSVNTPSSSACPGGFGANPYRFTFDLYRDGTRLSTHNAQYSSCWARHLFAGIPIQAGNYRVTYRFERRQLIGGWKTLESGSTNIVPASCSQPQNGMTWIHSASNGQIGTITVGCNGCDPYLGDTPCTHQIPLLCISKPTPAFPLPVSLNNADQYNLWAGGVIATSQPVAGSTFANTAAANAYCVAQFGANWRVAEFHDGWGWNFQAYGGTVGAPTVPSTRFWVYINDQPAANCWSP
jgi:hypothetical protein